MLLRLLALFLILWVIGRLFRALAGHGKATNRKPPPLVQDPACGLYIDPESAVRTLREDGRTVYFCSQDCYDTYLKKPGGKRAILEDHNRP